MEKKYCTIVVLAAGKGSRMGGKTAKQHMEIGGKPLVAYALEMFEASPVIDEIILVIDVGHTEYVGIEIMETYGLKKVSTIGAGGGERYKSVWKAFCTLMEREGEERKSAVRDRQDGYVFIHDRAHPSITGEIIKRTYRVVCSYNACVVGMPVKDTIKLVNQERIIESSPDRSIVWQVQIPQVFSVSLTAEAFARQMRADCVGVTDDVMVVEAQMEVKTQMVMSDYANIKVTTPEDLLMAEVLRNSVVQL